VESDTVEMVRYLVVVLEIKCGLADARVGLKSEPIQTYATEIKQLILLNWKRTQSLSFFHQQLSGRKGHVGKQKQRILEEKYLTLPKH
jgi:hypothetical protein